MKTSQLVVVALVVLGITMGPVSCDSGLLANPKPCNSDSGSQGPAGQGSCSGDISLSLHTVKTETSIEQISSSQSILSMEALAQHVVKSSQQALGFQAVLSEETLASMSWSFRLRYMPAPIVVAKSSTRFDVERLVRNVLTTHEFKHKHHMKECKIAELIAAVKASVETSSSFVFRMIEGDDSEYSQVHLHQVAVIQHYFSAIHTIDSLYVSVVSSQILGEFIKGHGGANAVMERASAAQFLRQWLLNQWVNLWICTNPARSQGTN